jgi:aquaporin Z
MIAALKQHWPEYLIEALGLGLFMISAFSFAILLEHPASPLHQALANPFGRRFLMGLAMGATAIGIIYSPWGKQSGAHINPSTTLAFYRLGKVTGWDAFYYVVAQFCGALLGAVAAALLLAPLPAHAAVNYVVTLPGPWGILAALIAEFAISFLLMTIILHVSNSAKSQNLTGLYAGALVALYITVEAPISGMSMNPARSLGSAVPAKQWADLWIYFTAPPIGMVAAAEIFSHRRGARGVGCAKLHHDNPKRCIFCGKPAGQKDHTISPSRRDRVRQ